MNDFDEPLSSNPSGLRARLEAIAELARGATQETAWLSLGVMERPHFLALAEELRAPVSTSVYSEEGRSAYAIDFISMRVGTLEVRAQAVARPATDVELAAAAASPELPPRGRSITIGGRAA